MLQGAKGARSYEFLQFLLCRSFSNLYWHWFGVLAKVKVKLCFSAPSAGIAEIEQT